MDLELKSGKLFERIEEKNWSKPETPYSSTVAETEILSRLKSKNREKAEFETLSIPNLNVFNSIGKKRILNSGIYVFENNKVITEKCWNNKYFSILKNQIRRKLKKLIELSQYKKVNAQKTLNTIYQQYPEHNPNNQTSQIFTLDNTSLTLPYDHDNTTTKTDIEQPIDTPSISYQEIVKQIEANNQALKLEETKRLRLLYG